RSSRESNWAPNRGVAASMPARLNSASRRVTRRTPARPIDVTRTYYNCARLSNHRTGATRPEFRSATKQERSEHEGQTSRLPDGFFDIRGRTGGGPHRGTRGRRKQDAPGSCAPGQGRAVVQSA